MRKKQRGSEGYGDLRGGESNPLLVPKKERDKPKVRRREPE